MSGPNREIDPFMARYYSELACWNAINPECRMLAFTTEDRRFLESCRIKAS